MKVLVANVSGNMGKTTLVKHLLSPRMPDARVICLESLNGGTDEIPSALKLEVEDEFERLVDIMAIEDELIVDLGSSESQQMIRKLKEYESAVHDFDLIIVPVVPDPKAQEDTISTVMTLKQLEVPREKIRILFNKVPVHQAGKVSVIFAQLIQAVRDMAIVDTNLSVFQYEIYNALKSESTTVSDSSRDKNDWKSIARNSTLSDSERIDALQNNRNQKAAPAALKNLDSVFDLLIAY